jgi:hypothetical protein
MNELIELLERFGLDATSPDYTTLSDEQLAELQTELFALFDATRDGDTPDLELLEAIALGGEAIRQEDSSRQEQAEADATRIAELEQQLRPAAEGDDDAGDGSDDAEGDAGDEDAGDDAGEGEGADDAEGADAGTPVAVAAAATPATPARRVPLSDLAANRTRGQAPTADGPAESRQVVLTAGGDIPGVTAGQPLEDLTAAAHALRNRLQAVDGILPEGQRVIVARAHNVYPEERQLTRTDTERNEARVEAVVASARDEFLAGREGTVDALAAAGGRCGPLPARYDVETLGTDARPIASGLPSFTDARGGVRFIPGPVLSDVDLTGTDAAVSQWTNAQDTAAVNDSGTRKAIQRIVCADEVTVEDYAVVKRLLVGTALARTNPERLRAMIDLVNVAHARMAEGLLLTRIKSVLATQGGESGQVLGSRRDLLAEWIKAAWAIRNHYRMPEAEVLQLIIPDAVIAHAQIDGVRQMPGDQRDRLTREEVVGELRAIGVDVIISPDFPAHLAPAQTAGAQLRDLPAPIEWAMFPMGTLSYIDGGEFDLGFSAGTPIRDTATLAANDYQLFGENWETVAKFGGAQVIWGRTMVAPTGEVAGTVDVTVDSAS